MPSRGKVAEVMLWLLINRLETRKQHKAAMLHLQHHQEVMQPPEHRPIHNRDILTKNLQNQIADQHIVRVNQLILVQRNQQGHNRRNDTANLLLLKVGQQTPKAVVQVIHRFIRNRNRIITTVIRNLQVIIPIAGTRNHRITEVIHSRHDRIQEVILNLRGVVIHAIIPHQADLRIQDHILHLRGRIAAGHTLHLRVLHQVGHIVHLLAQVAVAQEAQGHHPVAQGADGDKIKRTWWSLIHHVLS